MPALPTGMKWKSGASPSTSTTSKAAVFWPSMRSLLTEFTRCTGYLSASSRAMLEAVVEVALHLQQLRVVGDRLAELAHRDLALRYQHRGRDAGVGRVGRRTLADVLPVEAQITALAPCSMALETAIVIPRSLKEPVGFMPSNFTQTRAPVRDDSAGAGMSGVPPSPRVMTGRLLRHIEAIGVFAENSPPLVRHGSYSPSTRRVDWTLETAGFAASASTVEASDDSDASWVTMTRVAVGESASWRTDWLRVSTETPWSANTVAMVASTPGLVGHRERHLVAGADGATAGAPARSAWVDSATPGPPATWRRAAETRSPSTAEAVSTLPAPAP